MNFYYILVISLKILEVMVLMLYIFSASLSIILAALIIQLIVLIKIQPYKYKMARPILNNIITFAIELMILLFTFLTPIMRAYSIYTPFVILALLCLALIYSAYYIFLEIGEKRG